LAFSISFGEEILPVKLPHPPVDALGQDALDRVGGPLDGMTGHLLSVRGMRTRRLIVELPGMLTSAVEVSPDYIRFV